MPGRPEASVTLLVKGKPDTVVSTGRLGTDLDESQYARGYGPCLHTSRTGEVTEVPDTRTEQRWRNYMQRAAEHGSLSSLSVPLAIDTDVTGALNIHARQPDAFDEKSRSLAVRFGPYASVAVGNMHAYRSARDMADNLRTAFESRAVIDQAKGVLIERYKLTADQACPLLAQASMKANRKVRDVADHLVHTGNSRSNRSGQPAAPHSHRPHTAPEPGVPDTQDSHRNSPGGCDGQAPPLETTGRRGRPSEDAAHRQGGAVRQNGGLSSTRAWTLDPRRAS